MTEVRFHRLPGLAARLTIGVLLAAGLSFQPPVEAGPIYRCQNAAGVVEYSNAQPADAAARNCQKLDLPNITTIPAPTPQTSASTSSASSPAGFPKVSAANQKARDEERARILADELRREEERLAGLRTAFNGGEPERQGDERNYQKYLDRVERMRADIARHESNVESLRRELGGMKN